MDYKIFGEEGCLNTATSYLCTLPYSNARKIGDLKDLSKKDEEERTNEFLIIFSKKNFFIKKSFILIF